MTTRCDTYWLHCQEDRHRRSVSSGGLLPLLERTTAESSLLAHGSPDQHLRHSVGQSSFIYCTYSNLLSIPYFIIYSNIFTLCTTNMLCCCQHCLLSIYTLTSSYVYTYLLNKADSDPTFQASAPYWITSTFLLIELLF